MEEVKNQNLKNFVNRVDALLTQYPNDLRKAAKILAKEDGMIGEKVALKILQSRMLTNLGL